VYPNGRVGNKRVFYQSNEWVPDGIRVAQSGNIYTCTGTSLDIIDSDGILLGKILFPTYVTNLQFTGDGGLWVVGSGPVYRITIAEKN
jgi:gluconolactonase